MSKPQRERAATLTGQAVGEIQEFRLQLYKLRSLGLLIDLEIKGAGMFTVSASLAEFGIADGDARVGRLLPGRKHLIPDEVVKRLRVVEARFRQTLEKYSYHVSAFYPYRWIPFTAYEEWRAEWDRLAEEWSAIKREILKRHDEFNDALAAQWAEVAEAAWVSIRAQNSRRVEVEGVVFKDKDVFIDFIVGRAVARMPTRDKIKSGLIADYRTAVLDDEGGEAQSVSRGELGESAAVAKLEAMQQAEMEHARKLMASLQSPLDEVFADLRARIQSDVSEMLASVQKNGFLKGKIAEKGQGLLEFYDLMAVHDDSVLREKLLKLKQAIGPIGRKERREAEAERDVAEIEASLKEILKLAETEEDVLLDSRFDFIEV